METEQKTQAFFLAMEQAIEATAALENASDVANILRLLKPDHLGLRHDAMVSSLTKAFGDGDRETGARLAAASLVLNYMEPHVVVAWMLANASVIIQDHPHVLDDDNCHHWAGSLAETIQRCVEMEPEMMHNQVGEA